MPWSAIDAYARRYGIVDIDEFDRLVTLIRACERAWFASRAAPAT